MLDSNCLYVKDENGNEKKFIILFTFDSDDTKKQYVIYQDPEGNETDVYASIYDEQGNLFPIETDEEWEMVEEVVNTFQEDEEDA